MVRLNQRGAEQGHDGVPHVLVDGAAMVDDDIAHGVQKVVQHSNQGLRVIFQIFRNGGKTPDVGEQEGNLPALTPQAELFGVLQHLLDHGGGDIGFEGLADPLPFPLFRQEPLHGDAHVDQGDAQQGIEELQVEVQRLNRR